MESTSCGKCINGWLVDEVTRMATACECRKASLHEYMMKKTGLPARYWKASLDNYDAAPGATANALRTARAYIDELPLNKGTGLLFTGTVGTGKTHLSVAILREVAIRYSMRTQFVDLRELLKKMQASYGTKDATEHETLRPILEAELLVLDEIGGARSTEWSFDVVEHIINVRYNDELSTIITTNLANKPLGWRPGAIAIEGSRAERLGGMTAAETLGDRIGSRMFSRLQQMCKTVELSGEDYRARGRA